MPNIRYLLRLTRGSGHPRDLVLRRERPHPIFGVGTESGWRVLADDVEPTHLLVAFNGRDLYVAAHPAVGVASLPRLDGAAITTRWIPVRHTAHLELGRARIAVLPRPAAPRAPAARRPDEVTATGDPEVIRHLREEARADPW